MLSDHGQTQGATFRQRNGYGLDELVERSLAAARSRTSRAATRTRPASAGDRRGDRAERTAPSARAGRVRPSDEVVVLGSGNLGLDLPDGEPAPADARGDRGAAPAADPGPVRAPAHRLRAGALRRRRRRGARRRAAATGSPTATSPATDPLAGFSSNAARHLLRTDGFPHVADIVVNSFYDPRHGGGLRVRGADLVPRRPGGPADAAVHPLPGASRRPAGPLVGAEAVHRLLREWRNARNSGDAHITDDSHARALAQAGAGDETPVDA